MVSTRTILHRWRQNSATCPSGNCWTDAVIWSGEATSTADALRQARADGSDLRGSNLRGSKLRAAGEYASRSDGYEFRLFQLEDGTLRIMAGCRWFTLGEAREHWTATSGTRLGDESLALVDHLERMARIAGWL